MLAGTRLHLALAMMLAAPIMFPRPALLVPAVGLDVHRLDQQSVGQVEDLGIRHVRYTLYWAQWQDPLYRLHWEQGLERALKAGLELLVVVHHAPFGSFQERDLVYASFARFMAARAAQFPQVRAWQLWNEMDVAFTDLFGAGRPEISMRQRGRYYAQMLHLAYPAIKSSNPGALVVTGGLASSIEEGFLAGLYDAGAPYDVLAIHTYGFPLMLPFEARGRAARRIMRSHGDDRPLWNTEFGLEARVIPAETSVTPAQVDSIHLEAWRTSIEGNARERFYDRIYGYVLSEGQDLGFDLVRSDGSPRPAYRWLKSWSRH
jgi:hypothetical protein